MDEKGQPCALLVEHLEISRQQRDAESAIKLEIFNRLRLVEAENAVQTTLLRSLDANVCKLTEQSEKTADKLTEQSEKTAATYQMGRGVLWTLGGIATFIFSLPSLIDLFHRVTGGGK